ncbi:MAG: hypothetical protein HYR85_26095 [Planctomycetes bacterium]|nr:hypothetical protein [Planctomycetota bacterium]
MLALGYRIEQMIESGEALDYAEVARRIGVSRARVAQVTGLMLLAPAIQEAILVGELRLSERRLRSVLHHASWEAQRHATRA